MTEKQKKELFEKITELFHSKLAYFTAETVKAWAKRLIQRDFEIIMQALEKAIESDKAHNLGQVLKKYKEISASMEARQRYLESN